MFFQNVFAEEYQGNWVLGDRHHQLKYVCLPNAGRGKNVCHAFIKETYDLSGNDSDGNDKSILSINYAFDLNLMNYAQLNITIDAGAASGSAVTANEIVNNLNNNVTFAEYFLAEKINITNGKDMPPYTVRIKSKVENKPFRFYISNKGAERVLKFNHKAGISELPVYFSRHTINNRFNFSDSAGMLIPLNHIITANTVANPTVVTSVGHGLANGQSIIISNSNCSPTIDGTRVVTVINGDTFSVPVNVTVAGTKGLWSTLEEGLIIQEAVNFRGESLKYDKTNPKEDWELLHGSSGLFTFKKQTVDGSSRILKIIEYPAGAKVGDLAKLTQYTYTSSQTAPDQVTEIPYTLTSADLVTPG